MSVQLPLNIKLRDDRTLESFFPAQNEEILSTLSSYFLESSERFLFLWGREGVGRTHLLQAACQKAIELGLGAVYFPLKDLHHLSPDSLQGLESVPLICLDDIDTIAGNKEWEESIFHLFNKIRAEKGRLMISALCPPNQLQIQLADLKSRLTWGMVYQLHPMEDEQKLEALALRAKCRGFKLSKTVGQFLLNRCPRNMNELFNLLECLDEASLTAKRRLTIPFVKEVLHL